MKNTGIIGATLFLAACTLTPLDPNAPTTYAAVDAYACALAFMSPANFQNYSDEISVCQQQCLQQHGLICVSCEGAVQTEGWAFCRNPVNSPTGSFYINAWLGRLASHPEIVQTQQVGLDMTVGVGLAHPEQVQVVGACDRVADADLFNGLAGCAGKWAKMVCDTVQGDGVCPAMLPPVALTTPPDEAAMRAYVNTHPFPQPWEGAEGGREAFRKKVMERVRP